MNNTKIVAVVKGGLGNQLFIYSAARRLSIKNNCELVLDDTSGYRNDVYGRGCMLHKFNISARRASERERMEPFGKIRHYALRNINKAVPFHYRNYIFQDGTDFDCRLLTQAPRQNLYLDGYWQSEEYFKDVETEIRRELSISSPNDSALLDMKSRMQEGNSVAVHVRFFDKPNEHQGNNLPMVYYTRAVHEMEKHNPGASYFIFSDYPEYCQEYIPLPADKVTYISGNHSDELAHLDLWLMTQCKNFIIANSTFSWWGAWLSNNPTKYVISPGKTMRNGKIKWGFPGLLPPEWHIL